MLADVDRRVWIALGLASLAGILLFMAAALVAMLVAGGAAQSLPPAGYLFSIFRFTALQAVLSTLLSVGLALPLALAMARRPQFPGRTLILQIMALPLSLPVIVGAFAIIEIWGRQGFLNSLAIKSGLLDQPVSIYGLSGILIAHVFFNLPLAARLMLQALDRIPAENWQLAAGLNLGRLSIFRFVELPALRQVTGNIAALIFMLCATSFTLVLVLGGGPGATTLEVAIYQSLKFDYDPARAILLAGLQIGLSAIAFLGLNWFRQDNSADHPINRSFRRLDGAGLIPRLSDTMTIGAFLLFAASPFLTIILSGLSANLPHVVSDPLFLRALRTSLIVAFTAGFLTTLLTVLMIQSSHGLKPAAGNGKTMAAIVGLLGSVPAFAILMPTLVLATGWFLLLQAIGLADDAGPVIVILINMLMAMPFSIRVLGPALATHHRAHDRLAASLRLTGLARLWLLDWPCLKIPLVTAFFFATALSLGDLGAIAVFGSDAFMTLPALLHAKLGSYRSNDAAAIALVLAALALVLSLPAAWLESSRRLTR